MPDLIGVTGATGGLGGRVARRLAGLGVEQRLVVRDPARAPHLPGARVARADFRDAAAMRAALAGVSTLVLVSASVTGPDRVSTHAAAVDAAVAAGVSRVVYLSFLAAGPTATFTFAREHWATEEHIRGSGIGHTFLRDSLYQDALPYFAGRDGVIRGPAGDGRVGAVARDDIAEAVLGVLTGGQHDGRTYDLTGPRALSLNEVAAELSRASGREVTYHPETIDEAYASRAGYGAPDWEVAGWVTSYTAIAAGELDVVTDAVERLTGHPPMTFADFLAANPQVVGRLRGPTRTRPSQDRP